MKLSDLARETHLAELKRKEELTTALSFPVALLTALAAALASIVSKLSWPLDRMEWLLLVLSIGAAAIGCYVAIFLVLARIAHTYFYPAKISAITDWYNSVIASGRNVEEADQLLEAYLLEEYVKCGSRNSDNNDKRSAQLFRANQALVGMLLVTAVAGLPYIALNIIAAPLKQSAACPT